MKGIKRKAIKMGLFNNKKKYSVTIGNIIYSDSTKKECRKLLKYKKEVLEYQEKEKDLKSKASQHLGGSNWWNDDDVNRPEEQ